MKHRVVWLMSDGTCTNSVNVILVLLLGQIVPCLG